MLDAVIARTRSLLDTGSVRPALSGVSSDALATAYAQCAQIARSRARNFYHGLRLTPEPRRSAIYSIYAWMRAADDVADANEPGDVRREHLREFREESERVLAGKAPSSRAEPWWAAFGATVASYPLEHVIFHDMLDGLDEDLETVAYQTDEALSKYCYRVAGTAGLACIWIWGLRAGADPAVARDLALRRGQAFQRTNILRDFAEDFDASPSRVYLPAESFEQHQVSPADVRTWSKPEPCARFVKAHAQVTRDHYIASAALESMVDPACSPTLWAMTKIYSGILELVERDPERVAGDRRIRLAGTKKASIAIGAALWAKMGRW